MDLLQLISSFTITTWLFLITIFLFSFIKFNKKTSESRKLPPGPWKLPIIGSMYHILGNAPTHEILSNLAKKYGPVMHLQVGQISAVVFSSPEMVKFALKTNVHAFLDRPSSQGIAGDVLSYNKSDIAFAPYGDYWRQMRKLCVHELLSATRVNSYRSIRENEVAKMISSIRKSEGSSINLSAQFFTLSSSILSNAVLGDNINDQGLSFDFGLLDELLSLIGGCEFFFPSLKFLSTVNGTKTKLEKVHRKLDTMLQEIIDKHREYDDEMQKSSKRLKEKEGILDTLLRHQKQNTLEVPLTDSNVKAVTLDMFIGGSESSAITIEWAMSELIRNPEKMEKVQSEVKEVMDRNKNIEEDTRQLHYLNLVIKETLRLHPPAPILLPRECREACVINGYHIPVKTKVIINVWAIGRDPNVWEDAKNFIPERFENSVFDFYGNNFEYLPFGSGRRICPGIAFGLATVELALIQLLYHFNWKLPNNPKGESIDMTEVSGIAGKKKIPLHLVASARE